MLLSKATAPFRLCGDKIRTPVGYVSKAICFFPETIADGGSTEILDCYMDVVNTLFRLFGGYLSVI